MGSGRTKFDGGKIAPGCLRNCNGKLLKPGRTEWWVKMRTKDRAEGWTKDASNFVGQDA